MHFLHRIIGRFMLTGDLSAVPLELLINIHNNYLLKDITVDARELPWSEMLLQVSV